MGSPPPSDERRDESSLGPQIEWVSHDQKVAAESSEAVHSGRAARRARAAAIAMLCIAVGLVAASFARAGGVAETPVDEPSTRAAAVPPPVSQSSLAEVFEDVPLIDQLPSATVESVEGELLAWIDASGHIRLRSLATGVDLETNVLAAATLPPLPSHVNLLGAPNSTWLLNVEDTARSGKLSNTVRMVRFGRSLDSYGFSSMTDDGSTAFFVGSLWGPAMNGLAEVDANHDVFYVPNGGIVVAGRDGTSSIVVGSGLEELPSRLGRIVAATAERVAGIHCDDLGRCVGRIAGWDGGGEVQVNATALAEPVVRISPDGRKIVSGGGSTWSVIDVEAGTHRTVPVGVALNDSTVWSTDSSTILFIESGALIAADFETDRISLERVRSFGEIGERLEGSDIATFTSTNAP